MCGTTAVRHRYLAAVDAGATSIDAERYGWATHRVTEPQSLGVRVDDALRAAAGLLRRRAGAVLPYYALLAGTTDVARLPLVLAAVVVYAVLVSTGRLDSLIDDLAALVPKVASGRPRPTATAVRPGTVQELVETLASPDVAGPILVGVGVAVCSYVLARGVARAAALAALDAGFDDRDPLTGGVGGVDRWRTFVGLVVVRWGLLAVAALPVVAAVMGVGATLGAVPSTGTAPTLDSSAALAVLAALAGVVVTVVAVVAVLTLLAFAGPAAVVDDVGVRGAVRRSAGVPLAHPGDFLLYGVVVVGTYVGVGVGAALLGVAGVGRLVALAVTYLVAPLLDGLAVALYRGWRVESDTVDAEGKRDAFGADGGVPNASDRERPGMRRALRAGVSELVGFCRDDWRYVVAATAVLACSIAGGWAATAGYGVRIPAPADPRGVFGTVPVGPFVNIAVNNWLVAASAGFSGVFGGVPAAGTLLFNGLLVGGVAGVVDPATFVALVAPHGVVELPAIAVAGGVGLRLGHVAWGVWRGQRRQSDLADELERAWRVVVGLAVVFVVSGFVEAFVTPQVAAAVLG